MLLLMTLTGCSSIVLYPIVKQDMVIMNKNESYTPDRDGLFLSDLYFKKILKVKVKKVNLE